MAGTKRLRPATAEVSSVTPTAAQTSSSGLPVDAAVQAWLADLGELAGPMAHGFSNFLNVVLLHVAVLEQEGMESQLEDLAEIRRQGYAVDAWIKHFQKHRHEPRAARLRIDVNQAVLSAAEAWAGPGPAARAALKVDLAPSLPPVLGCGADVHRLVRLLLSQAAAAAGPKGNILVSTKAEEAVLLKVADSGPAPAQEDLPRMFEELIPLRPGTSALELAACRSLVRRLEGALRATQGPVGGVTVIVELPSAGDDGQA